MTRPAPSRRLVATRSFAFRAVASFFVAVLTLGCESASPPEQSSAAQPQESDAPTTAPSVANGRTPETEVEALVCEATGLSPDDLNESIALFDGSSTFGWEGSARVEDGELVVSASGEPATLVHFAPFIDFELEGTLRTSDDFRGGVVARSQSETDPASDANLVRVEPGRTVVVRVVCDGGQVSSFLDGEEQARSMAVVGDGVPDAGRVALVVEAGTLFVDTLSARPLNLEDLLVEDDWQVNGDVEATFSDDGVRLVGGLGFLQSQRQYDDFVLQARVVALSPTTNSGVFFRAMTPSKPTESNGYEMQVSPEFDGLRTKPTDAGAGAIFRRQDARLQLLDANEPTTLTLVASGDHFMTWVAGYPVAAFVDQRPDDPNPRRGRRLDAGHLLLQGHDPGTDVRFQRLALQPFPNE